jgi:hypothetical protein
MTPMFRAILAAALLAGPAIASAQTSTRITTAEIDGHLRFLSSDLLEGRAPGVNGSYFQDVPIDIVGADVSSITMTASGKATSSLRYPQDVAIVHRVGTLLANSDTVPTWNKDAEFHSPRMATQP